MRFAIQRSMIVPTIVASALFMENLDGTIITTALPQMAVTFGTTPLHLSVGITAYVLSLAIFIPISGWVADRFGSRDVFRTAIVVFTIGSVLCGFCNGVGELAAARVLQGVGGAMMVPVGRLIVFRGIAKNEFVTAMAYMTVPALIGPTLGPPVGGFITTYWSWRWIFFLNVPVGLVGIALVSRFIENIREEQRRSLDWIGFLLLGTALASLVYVCDAAVRPDVDATAALGVAALGCVAGLAAVRHMRRRPDPVIDPSLLEIPTFGVSVLGGTIFRVGTASLNYLLPILLQIGIGFTAFTSGLLLIGATLGSFAMKICAIPVLRRFGFRNVLIGNAVMSAGSVLVCALFTPSVPFAWIFAALLVGGFFRSLQYTALNAMAFADVPAPRLSAATSFSSMMQQISNGMGVAVAAIVLNFVLLARGDPLKPIPLVDMQIALVLMGVTTLGSWIYFARLRPDAGAEVSGHPVPRIEAAE